MPAPVPFLVLHRVRAGVGLLLSIDPPVFCMTCLVLVKKRQKQRKRERESLRAREREIAVVLMCSCDSITYPPPYITAVPLACGLRASPNHQYRRTQVKYGTSHTAKTYQFEPVDKLSLDSNKVSGHQAAHLAMLLESVAKLHLAWVNYAPKGFRCTPLRHGGSTLAEWR